MQLNNIMAKAKKSNSKKLDAKKAYNSSDKAHFRESKKWKDFRKALIERDKVDYITKSKLNARANCHHVDMSSDNYEDLSHPENFVMLNKRTHVMIHMLFTYYKKDPAILDRIKYLLDRMVELN